MKLNLYLLSFCLLSCFASCEVSRLAHVQLKPMALYDQMPMEDSNSIMGFKAVSIYANTLDNTVWSSPEKQCVSLSKENKIDLNLILVENSTYSRTSLKKRLVEENILEYKCEKCSNVGEWLGKKITLQLDHKNGIFNDNRIENLRFLCPNCHSQTDTFAGKKMKKEKKQTTNLNSYVSRRKVERPPFNQLLNEITEMGYSGTGRKYGVSDNTIRKWLTSFEKNNAG